MSKPWLTLDEVATAEGALELRQRGPRDFLIVVGGRVLMSSTAFRSEVALAEAACRPIRDRSQPQVLIGGLGMGLTLRAALDVLPADARVVVAELNPVVERWCRGPLAALTQGATADPRVEVRVADVVDVLAAPPAKGWDAVALDLYEGPHAATQADDDPFYGRRALQRTRQVLASGGVFAVWSEDPDAAFERRLGAAGFAVEVLHPGRGGRRHAVYVGRVALGSQR